MPGFANKLSVLFKGIIEIQTTCAINRTVGPGWAPGKPRLGDPKDIPDVDYSAIGKEAVVHHFVSLEGYNS